jgi:hypothetical protein
MEYEWNMNGMLDNTLRQSNMATGNPLRIKRLFWGNPSINDGFSMAMFQKTQQKTGDLTDDNPGVSPTLGLQKQYRGIAATKLMI